MRRILNFETQKNAGNPIRFNARAKIIRQ